MPGALGVLVVVVVIIVVQGHLALFRRELSRLGHHVLRFLGQVPGLVGPFLCFPSAILSPLGLGLSPLGRVLRPFRALLSQVSSVSRPVREVPRPIKIGSVGRAFSPASCPFGPVGFPLGPVRLPLCFVSLPLCPVGALLRIACGLPDQVGALLGTIGAVTSPVSVLQCPYLVHRELWR